MKTKSWKAGGKSIGRLLPTLSLKKKPAFLMPLFFKVCFGMGIVAMAASAQTVDMALGKTATSSSNETASLTPNLAVDGNGTTRWASLASDPQWIRIDLGYSTPVTRVVLRWEAASGKNYTIDVSPDGSAWTTILTKTNLAAGARTDDFTVSGTGRYIRMNGTARTTTFGYSLYAFEVYGGTAPAITTQPQNVAVATGATATFTVANSGTGTIGYQWKKNGSNVSGGTGGTTASYTTPATVAGDNNAKFSVVVTNAAGTVTSADANLTVGTAPAISIPPANQSVLEGMPATFTATVTGQGLSFQWQKDGANILGATSATLVYYPAITDHNAKFRLKVTNFAGNVTSADAILSVVPTSAVYDNTIPGPLNTVNVKAEYGTQSDVTRSALKVTGKNGLLNSGEMTSLSVSAEGGSQNSGAITGLHVSAVDGPTSTNDMTGLSVFASKTATNTGHPAVGLSVTVEDLAHSQGGYAALFFGGNVGIGTPAPGEKLEVAGNARVTGDLIAGRVLTHTWKIPVPDYVFEKGYRLQSLEEVDAYVQKNKHLPEVPSAKEIKEKGLDLTDMNLKLLKKVEEMTLHMIALDKDLKEQSRKNGELEAELKSLKSKVR